MIYWYWKKRIMVVIIALLGFVSGDHHSHMSTQPRSFVIILRKPGMIDMIDIQSE